MKSYISAAILTFSAIPAAAENAIPAFFPNEASCYGRSYSSDHLNSHPEQRVTMLAIAPDFAIAHPMIGLWIVGSVRGVPGGDIEGYAYCENGAPGQLDCGMEGDAGSFTLSAAKNGGVLIEVGRYGMSFEANPDYVTLESHRGDDRSFILQPLANCP